MGGGSSTSYVYSGINASTPNFESLYFGSALRSVGVVNMPLYTAAVNFQSNATVNQGCVVSVEGCMDSTAVNYNSKATINTQSWCIPAEEGCMMPQTAYATSGKYSTASATAYQGLAVNYLSSVTIHNKSTCVVYYLGCMSSTALNYESHATVDSGDCWEPK